MTDLERLLAQTLRDAGENYEPGDQAEARRRFLERARRRRWYGFAQVAAVAGVGIAAFLFFTYNSGTEEKVKPKPEVVAGAPEIVAKIEVDGNPVSVDAKTGSEVWVAGKDRLVAIDPNTNRTGALIIDLPADEVAVGEGVVWAATDGSTGAIIEIDPETGPVGGQDAVTLDAEAGTTITWDIAADGETLWAVDGVSDRIYRYGPSSEELVVPGNTFTDVTIESDGDVWALDQEAGALVHVDAATGEPIGGPIEVPAGENADLIAGFQYVYVSPGNGSLYQITPPGTTDMVESDLGDSYMDLTVHEKSVWALVNVDDEHKELFEINPGTMEVIGEPLEIEGDANDVVAAAGSVWVADGRGEVLRIEPSRDVEEDAPPPAEEEDGSEQDRSQGPVDPDEVLFVYSANGDIYAQTINGDVLLLNPPSGDIEQHPSFAPDGQSIVYERIDMEIPAEDRKPFVIQLDLATGEEKALGDGAWPAMSSDGRVTWVSTATEVNDTEAAAIYITRDPSDTESAAANVVGTPELPNISHLSWSRNGDFLFYQAAGEGTVVKQSGVDGVELMGEGITLVPTQDQGGFNESSDFKPGSNLVSPHPDADGVLVLRLCCRDTEGDPFEEMYAGRVLPGIEGIGYEDIAPIPEIEGIAPSFGTSFVPAGHLDYDELSTSEDRWITEGDAQSWFVLDDDALWLVDSDGDAHYISGDPETSSSAHEGETDFRGLAVHPSLLN